MNKETILKTVLPKWFPNTYIEDPWRKIPSDIRDKKYKPYKYGDIPQKSFFVFDLIVNCQVAYNLVIELIEIAERTQNIYSQSSAHNKFQNVLNLVIKDYEKQFPDEESWTNCNLEPFQKCMLLNLIWLNKQRFV